MSYTLRINPVAPYDGPGMERWLETCAAQGLSLIHISEPTRPY